MPKKRNAKKSSSNKGEKIKSRVAFQGTIDRRKKTFEPKTPATSKPQFQSPDFNSPENSKAQARSVFLKSSSPIGNLSLLKKNNYKVTAARNAIVEQPNRSRNGKLLHMETSPRVGDHGFLFMSKGNRDEPKNFCDEPLGSPIRRMRRAMRFVDQNTCITQRVAIDIGSSTRIIIPCFEGVTTVMDLLETVKQRFPEHNITGLKLFGKVLPVNGFVAELVDSENVLLAISEVPFIEGVKPAGLWKDENSIKKVEEDGNGIVKRADHMEEERGEINQVKAENCNDIDDNNINLIDIQNPNTEAAHEEDDSYKTTGTIETSPSTKIASTTLNVEKEQVVHEKKDKINDKQAENTIYRGNITGSDGNSRHDNEQPPPPPISPSASLQKLKPFTPDRSILEKRLGSSNGRPKPNVLIKSKRNSTGKIKTKKENEQMNASSAVDSIRDDSVSDIGNSIKDPSNMNSLVRNRLLDRIVSLASRGAITPSQQKYLNSLISSGDNEDNASNVLVPKPPKEDMKKHSSFVIRSLKYNDSSSHESNGV